MDDLSNLQNQVNTFLTLPIKKPLAPARAALAPDLAVAESAVAPPSQRFSPFDPAQLERATDLLERFMALADSMPGKAGLDAVYEEANKAAASESPELVRYALRCDGYRRWRCRLSLWLALDWHRAGPH